MGLLYLYLYWVALSRKIATVFSEKYPGIEPDFYYLVGQG